MPQFRDTPGLMQKPSMRVLASTHHGVTRAGFRIPKTSPVFTYLRSLGGDGSTMASPAGFEPEKTAQERGIIGGNNKSPTPTAAPNPAKHRHPIDHVIDKNETRSTPRVALLAALDMAISSGDHHAARVAHSALGELLEVGGDDGGDVVDLSAVRRLRGGTS